jgi:hypothetical protein
MVRYAQTRHNPGLITQGSDFWNLAAEENGGSTKLAGTVLQLDKKGGRWASSYFGHQQSQEGG